MNEIRREIDSELENFTRARTEELKAIDIKLGPAADALFQFTTEGGKRFRPIFAYLGFLANGSSNSKEALRACAALEFVHVCALIHDDLMDGSDERRGLPSLHRKFEQLHLKDVLAGSPERFGMAAAILLGDLALSWSDQLIFESGIAQTDLQVALPVFYEMRAELMAGQYLDVLEGALAESNIERSRKIARYKSGRYSIERPLRFGAALAGASTSLGNALSRYGLPLGEAFQLRDDILGVFGDSALTGKPSGDDIREGKRTVLIALAAERLATKELEAFESTLGNPNLDETETSRIQGIIRDSGALSACEALIENLLDESISALDTPELDEEVKRFLTEMAIAATKRES